jgi:hypothetical protein
MQIAQDSGCDFSFWFAVSSPMPGVLLAMLALAIFVDDGRSYEHNGDRIRLDHSTVRFRFDPTRYRQRNRLCRILAVHMICGQPKIVGFHDPYLRYNRFAIGCLSTMLCALHGSEDSALFALWTANTK